MPRIIQKTVFQFDELGERAKQSACDWYRCAIEGDNFFAESIIEDATRMGAVLGIDTDKFSWSGFWLQGDGASFVGSYRYAKGSARRIREEAPQDKELHRIADALQAAQRSHFYRLQAGVTRSGLSNHYSHSGTMSVEVTDCENEYRDVGAAEENVRACLRDFADWVYRSLETEWDYQNADEQTAETIRANEYEFTAEGARA